MSSKAAEVPQNLPEARKQANSDGDTSPVSLSKLYHSHHQQKARTFSWVLHRCTLKRCEEGHGRRVGWRTESAGQEPWYRQAKITVYQRLGNIALRHQRIRCQKPTMSWQKVTGRERNETVFINSGSLCPSSRTPPPLPSGWGHWHVSWWAWNSPSSLVHTNGPLNPYTNGKTSKEKKKGKIQFLCHVKFSGIGCRKNGAEGQSSEVTSSFSWEAQSCVWNLG